MLLLCRLVIQVQHEVKPIATGHCVSVLRCFFFQAYTIQGQYAIPHPDVSFSLLFVDVFYVTCMLCQMSNININN